MNRLLLAILIGCPLAVVADETDDAKKPKVRPGWQKIFRAMAEDYRIYADDPEQPFTLLKEPIFRWDQPVRGGDDGAVYLWTHEGKPMVIGTIFAWPTSDGTRNVQHEVHSLAPSSLTARFRDSAVWTPDRAGVEYKPIPRAPKPSSQSAARLRQMRTLAEQFEATSTDHDGARWQLRLLTRPLYRYEVKEDPNALDGALYTFAQGTDPEIILLIEARRSGDEHTWHYACARFSDYRLQVSHEGQEVWTVARSGGNTRTAPHSFYITENRNPPAPDEADTDVTAE